MKSGKISALLLWILIALTTYHYITSNIIVKVRGEYETDFKTKITNPILIIFAGKTPYTEKGSYTSYRIASRLNHLLSLSSFILLIVGATRYFLTQGRKYTILFFSLVTSFWIGIASLAARPFYMIWPKLYPDLNIFNPYFFITQFLLFTIPHLAILWVLIKHIHSKTSDNIQLKKQGIFIGTSTKWLRASHYFIDRIIIIVLGMNVFIHEYFNSKNFSTGRVPESQLDVLMTWGIICTEVALVICYLLTEGFFNTSPSKILTNMTVVNDKIKIRPAWMNIVVRSLSRLIPFEFISIFANRLWHDQFSNTALAYTGAGNPIKRHAELMIWIFRFFLITVLWSLIAIFFDLSDGFGFLEVAQLPLFLVAIMFPFTALFFSCWIATISSTASNIGFQESQDANHHFFQAISCWIPILNFFSIGNILNDAIENLSRVISSDKLTRLQTRSKQLNRAFAFSYLILALGILLGYTSGRKLEMTISICVGLFALFLWNSFVLLFTKAIKDLCNNLDGMENNGLQGNIVEQIV